MIHVPALHEHIRGFLCFRSGDAGNIAHLGVQKEVFVGVCLVHVEPIYTELFKGYNIVLPLLRFQLLELGFQLLFGLLQLLD